MGKKRRSRAFKENSQVINFDEERLKRREKRKQLTEKKKGNQIVEAPISSRRASKKMKRRLVYCVIVLFILSTVGYCAYNVLTLRMERSRMQAANDALIKERGKLEKELSLVDSDEYIEAAARDELHMIKSGEVIYILPDEDQTESGTPSALSAAAVTTDGAVNIAAGTAAPEDGIRETDILTEAKMVLQDIREYFKTLVRK